EYIAAQLGLNGHPTHWLSEGMLLHRHFPHALSILDQTQPLSEATLLEEWAAFAAAALASDRVFVVDSALSYVAVAPLMMEDRPTEAIHAALGRVAEICAPLRPRVIHLTGDVDRLVPASIAERGPGWEEQLVRQAESAPYQRARGRSGVAGATSLFRESQELLDAILARGGWDALTLDVTAPDWAAHRRAILAFLGLAEVAAEPPSIDPVLLRAYVGTYATDDQERGDKVLAVRLEGETLVMHGPTMRYGALAPVSPTRFHLQATPLDIEFAAGDGAAGSLALIGSDGTPHEYRRV
ncbi:MAG TPA: hypothetical protein VD886_18995, partial [Herpetosiphonaceae bacterium]|nr:hypothetical protein [Herpetosiphonaceae bacterium]